MAIKSLDVKPACSSFLPSIVTVPATLPRTDLEIPGAFRFSLTLSSELVVPVQPAVTRAQATRAKGKVPKTVRPFEFMPLTFVFIKTKEPGPPKRNRALGCGFASRVVDFRSARERT